MPFYTEAMLGSGYNPQVPAGTVDGVNGTFTVNGQLHNLYLNQGFQTPNIDYTISISGSTTTINFVVPPVKGSVLYAT